LVRLRIGGAVSLAQITYDAAERLKLEPGLAVHALVKSVAVLRPGE
jgi:molybdopterin-binding protein